MIGLGVGGGIEMIRQDRREFAALDRGPRRIECSTASAVVMGSTAAIFALTKVDAYGNGYRAGYRQAQLDFERERKVVKARRRKWPKRRRLKS